MCWGLCQYSISAVLIALLLLASKPALGGEDDVERDKLIGAYDAATHAIRSYDLKVRLRNTLHYQPQEDIRTIHLLGPGQKPIVHESFTRQVWISDGRQRCESLASPSGKPEAIKVFTGETLQTLDIKEAKGTIRPLPKDQSFVGSFEGYEGLYREMFDGGSIVNLLRSRTGVTAQKIDNGGEQDWEIDSPAQVGQPYSRHSLRLTLSAEHGMMPVSIDVSRNTKPSERFQTVIDKFRKLDDGTWVPLSGVTRRFVENELFVEFELQVIEPDSNWNKRCAAIAIHINVSGWNESPRFNPRCAICSRKQRRGTECKIVVRSW